MMCECVCQLICKGCELASKIWFELFSIRILTFKMQVRSCILPKSWLQTAQTKFCSQARNFYILPDEHTHTSFIFNQHFFETNNSVATFGGGPEFILHPVLLFKSLNYCFQKFLTLKQTKQNMKNFNFSNNNVIFFAEQFTEQFAEYSPSSFIKIKD